MLVPELKSSQRHPPSPKKPGGTEVKIENHTIPDSSHIELLPIPDGASIHTIPDESDMLRIVNSAVKMVCIAWFSYIFGTILDHRGLSPIAYDLEIYRFKSALICVVQYLDLLVCSK